MARAQARQGRTRVRWLIIWVAFAGLTINYLDRASLSVALPLMGEDFHMSATQQGLVFAAFFWAHDACQLVIGAVALVGAFNYLVIMGRIEPLKTKGDQDNLVSVR